MLHKMIIRSIENREQDLHEVGELVLINGYTHREHIFSLWTDDNFSEEDYKTYSCNVWINIPISFTNFKQVKVDDLQSIFDNEAYDLDIDDLIDEASNIRKLIKDNYISGESYSIEIPYEQQKYSTKTILTDEIKYELAFKIKNGNLNKKDLMELILLLEGDSIHNNGEQTHLIEPLQQFIYKQWDNVIVAPIFMNMLENGSNNNITFSTVKSAN